MVQFSVPDVYDDRCFRFSVTPRAVLLAGSRHREVDFEVCTRLVHAFWSLHIGFLTGCAPGVDRCFRRTLYLVKRCALLLVFPDDPRTGAWGKGSTLAFRTCVSQPKPVFVVSTLALNQFSHMLCGHYKTNRVRFHIEEKQARIKDSSLLDVLSNGCRTYHGRLEGTRHSFKPPSFDLFFRCR